MASDTPDGEKYVNEDWFTSFMRARRNEVVGLVMSAAGLFLLVSVITHHPFDPTMNAAAPGEAANAFGAWGAMVGDLALQWLGWAGAALGVMLAAWGVTMLARGPRRRGPKIVSLRLVAALLAIFGLATAASSLPIPATWPFAVGLGGLIGDAAHGEITLWLSAVNMPFAGAIAGLVGLAAALIGMFTGYGVTPDDVADAAESAGRVLESTTERARRATERFTRRVNAEIVALHPMEAPESRQLPHPQVRPTNTAPAGMGAARSAPQPAARPHASRPEPARPASMRPEPVRQAPQPAPAPMGRRADPAMSEGAFALPDISLLEPAPEPDYAADEADLESRAAQLERVLSDFGVKGEVVAARPGPVVTLFEFEPAPGVRSARVIGLADDLARSLAAQSARVAVVPGRTVIGIELPSPKRDTVYLSRLFDSEPYQSRKSALPLALGETIGGDPFVADLARMPHLLIAGTTGSGKSVGINAMILSIMYNLPPDRCRFLMVDPKMLELSVYDGIPHLLSPVLTDPKKAVAALKWTVREMERRYATMARLGVRNIGGFNRRVEDARERGFDYLESADNQPSMTDANGQTRLDLEPIPADIMPYIVVVIDEMADLMLVAGKEIESLVQRLAQMARAAGIHLIAATQRPSVDVITGTIKANFPTRISYMVTSKVDSRTILGEQGAEQLLGQGDLLYMAGGGRVRRLHGPFVSDEDVENIAQFFRAQGAPEYVQGIDEDPDEDMAEASPAAAPEGNDLYDQAVYVVTTHKRASTSYLQRQLSIGYNRAANLMDRLEAEGVVSAPNHAGRREVLAPPPPQVANGEM